MLYLANKTIPMLMNHDPEKEQHEQARLKAAANLRRLQRSKDEVGSGDDDWDDQPSGRSKKQDLVLDQYENQIALEVVAPEDIPVGFDGMLVFHVSMHADMP